MPIQSIPSSARKLAFGRAPPSEPGGLIIPSPVTAEIDYLLGQRFGRTARGAFLRDLAAGRFIVSCPDPEDYTKIARLRRTSVGPRADRA